MEQLGSTMGAPSEDITARLAFAIQFTLILFFIISPIMGYFIAQGIKKRANFFIGWGIGVLIVLLGSFGLSFILRQAIPVTMLSDIAIGLLSSVASVAAGILLAKYIVWVMGDPGKAAWVIEHEKLQEDDLLPFERRRRAEEERRKKARKL
jgi:hypothetical protein